MPFVSDNARHTEYFRYPAVLLDTSALTWFANRADGLLELDAVMARYHLIITTTVLFELAFGPIEASHIQELAIRDKFFKSERQIEFHWYQFSRMKGLLGPGTFSVVSPGFNEWWTARDRVLKYSRLAGMPPGQNKRNLSMDALIHACARNTFSPICTENLGDFRRLNQASEVAQHDGSVPIFRPQQVLDSLTQDVRYLEN